MPKAARDVHGLLQHDHREGDSRDPRDEAKDAENAENDKHDSCWISVLDEIIDGCPESEEDIQYAGDPDELLCKSTCCEEIGP